MKEILMAIGLVILITFFCWLSWANGLWPTVDEMNEYSDNYALNTYERVYAECMGREVIGSEYCHDLAVQAAYPARK